MTKKKPRSSARCGSAARERGQIGFGCEDDWVPALGVGTVFPAGERRARCERNKHAWVSDDARKCECGQVTRKFCRACQRAL